MREQGGTRPIKGKTFHGNATIDIYACFTTIILGIIDLLHSSYVYQQLYQGGCTT